MGLCVMIDAIHVLFQELLPRNVLGVNVDMTSWPGQGLPNVN